MSEKRRSLTFEETVADALQRIIAPVAFDSGGEGIVLQNYVIVSDWQGLDGSRGVHIISGVHQPEYITRALLNEGLIMAEEPDQEEVDD